MKGSGSRNVTKSSPRHHGSASSPFDERNEVPSIDFLREISEFFGLSPAEILLLEKGSLSCGAALKRRWFGASRLDGFQIFKLTLN